LIIVYHTVALGMILGLKLCYINYIQSNSEINNAKISVDRVMQVDIGLCLLMTNNSAVSSATDEMDITLKSSSVEQVDDIGS